MMQLPRFLSNWLGLNERAHALAAIQTEIDNALAARKAHRLGRQEAARKGWATRRRARG